jgi:hypothetical protein
MPNGVVESVVDEARSIVTAIISILRMVINYIYSFLQKVWSYFAENPTGAVLLLANIWVLAS